MYTLIYFVPALLSIVILDKYLKEKEIKKESIIYLLNALMVNLIALLIFNYLFNMNFMYDVLYIKYIIIYVLIAAFISFIIGILEAIIAVNFKLEIGVLKNEKNTKKHN